MIKPQLHVSYVADIGKALITGECVRIDKKRRTARIKEWGFEHVKTVPWDKLKTKIDKK